MKMLTPKGMKTVKVFHLLFIMMWTVGVLVMGLLYWKPYAGSLDFLFNQSTALFIDYTLVIPGAILSVVTGVVYGIKTKWGFFKHRWLKIKWIVGIAIILIGTFGLHPQAVEIINQANVAVGETVVFPANYFGPKLPIVKWMALLQGIGLIFLIWVSVFKPWNKKKNN